jgi:hydroxysqualene dehydroxylase
VISASEGHVGEAQDELAQRVAADIARAFGLLPKLLWHRVIAEKRATFSCTPGLARPAAQTPCPGFVLAGDYVAGDYPATIEGAVRSGVACASAILQ